MNDIVSLINMEKSKIEHLYEICFRIEDDIDAEIETEDYEEMVAKYH